MKCNADARKELVKNSPMTVRERKSLFVTVCPAFIAWFCLVLRIIMVVPRGIFCVGLAQRTGLFMSPPGTKGLMSLQL